MTSANRGLVDRQSSIEAKNVWGISRGLHVRTLVDSVRGREPLPWLVDLLAAVARPQRV